jgi:hypothetical protein
VNESVTPAPDRSDPSWSPWVTAIQEYADRQRAGDPELSAKATTWWPEPNSLAERISKAVKKLSKGGAEATPEAVANEVYAKITLFERDTVLKEALRICVAATMADDGKPVR